MSIDASKYTTGIYLITNTVTGAVYVGSTSNSFRERWNLHRNLLKRKAHDNSYLQNAWNKYGEHAFTFEVIEVIEDISIIIQREQAWIDYYYSFGRQYCYNLRPAAGPNENYLQTDEEVANVRQFDFVSPDGTEHRNIINLSAFCKAHKLPLSDMLKIANGKNYSCYGWTALNADHSRKLTRVFSFIGPDGMHYRDIDNLNAFCNEYGLSASHMSMVASGKKLSYKGWTAIDADRSRMLTRQFAFISPDGELYADITNLTQFCKMYGLTTSLMSMVHAGILPYHKGWRKARS